MNTQDRRTTPTHEAQPETNYRHLHPKHYPTTTEHTPERRMDNTTTAELSATKGTATVF
jgi:hypothetical protein